MTFPTEWKNRNHVPNHQPDIYNYKFTGIYGACKDGEHNYYDSLGCMVVKTHHIER